MLKLDPNGSASLGLTMRFLVTDKQVSEAEGRIAALQTKAEPIIHAKPQKGWCAR